MGGREGGREGGSGEGRERGREKESEGGWVGGWGGGGSISCKDESSRLDYGCRKYCARGTGFYSNRLREI